MNGYRNVPYLNRNDAKRNLNLNWNDNDFNENCRFLLVRNSLLVLLIDFLLELPLPAAELLTRFFQGEGNG